MHIHTNLCTLVVRLALLLLAEIELREVEAHRVRHGANEQIRDGLRCSVRRYIYA